MPSKTVLLTDYAWPVDSVEREIIEAAGYQLVSGPATPASANEVEALVRQHQPEGILTCWARVSAEAIAASPDLRIVARMGVGLDNIDVKAATQKGAWVTNVPDYCVEEVSDHAIALTLAWARGVVVFDRAVRRGEWKPAGAQLRRVSTLTCGIVGYGRIGRATARKLAAFGCRILVNNRSPIEQGAGDVPVSQLELDDLMRQSDVVIIQAPLNDSTHHLINARRIALMPKGGLLVNVSRGGVVDTQAVIDALQSGQLSGAGLDVLESEPQVPPALIEQSGATLTPHIAFSSDASLTELRRRAAEEVVRVLRGQPPEQPCNQPASA